MLKAAVTEATSDGVGEPSSVPKKELVNVSVAAATCLDAATFSAGTNSRRNVLRGACFLNDALHRYTGFQKASLPVRLPRILMSNIENSKTFVLLQISQL